MPKENSLIYWCARCQDETSHFVAQTNALQRGIGSKKPIIQWPTKWRCRQCGLLTRPDEPVLMIMPHLWGAKGVAS